MRLLPARALSTERIVAAQHSVAGLGAVRCLLVKLQRKVAKGTAFQVADVGRLDLRLLLLFHHFAEGVSVQDVVEHILRVGCRAHA